jgi:hypothetical protein
MSVISLLIFVVIVGLVLWLFETQIPTPPWVKTVVRVVLILIVMVWLLSLLGFEVPRLRLR